MDLPNQKLKIPWHHCNQPLQYASMEREDRELYYQMGSDYGMPYACKVCRKAGGCIYYCSSCEFGAHEECIDFPEIINHPCHSRHPLKIVQKRTIIDYSDGRCHFCRSSGDPMYHCSICNFNIDLNCWRTPPPLTIYQPKSHDHTFTLMPRKAPFTCNACGMDGDRNPYVCLVCDFMLHKDCIDLPRVININRHEHRIFRTYHLGHGDWESCGVCRKEIDWTFGAFYCKRCPSYAVHSKCATREDVWDGEELEDKPEDEEEIEDPYKVINENEIIHFSHGEHILRLGEGNVKDFEKMRCDACILPINVDPFFKCVQCEFFLHKVCASLPRKKRNIMHNHKLTLRVNHKAGKHFKCALGGDNVTDYEKMLCGACMLPINSDPFFKCVQHCEFFLHEVCASLPRRNRDIIHSHKLKLVVKGEYYGCTYCGQYFDGFSYTCPVRCSKYFKLDVRCGSISEPFHHELHPHPLYRTSTEYKLCGACGKTSAYVLNCTVCKFALGIECATLPRKVKHRCDDHDLSLHHGAGNSKGQLWCDICEGKADPSVWYYGCDDCGVTLHIKCVLGDMYYFKPGNTYWRGELVPNNGMSRPFCIVCEKRCMFPFFLKGIAASDSTAVYACSMECADATDDIYVKWYEAVKEDV